MNILLDYFFPISAIEPTPSASTGFLKQACIVVKPKGGVTVGEITQCNSFAEVAVLTDNTEAQELFNAGMNRVSVLPMNDLNLAGALEGHESDFFTLLISSDFEQYEVEGTDVIPAVKAEAEIQDIDFEAVTAGAAGNSISIEYADETVDGSAAVESVTEGAILVHIESGVTTATAIATAINGHGGASALVLATVKDGQGSETQTTQPPVSLEGGSDEIAQTEPMTVGAFQGVVGVQGSDQDFVKAQGAVSKRSAFHSSGSRPAKNMFYAFGKLLSNALNWLNQQYIPMPYADDVNTLGKANALFDDKVSFVISDAEFSNRLALFAQGGKAIIAPYVIRNLELDMQSKALQYVASNQPGYTRKAAALLEDELQGVIQGYIDRQWIEAGTVEVKLEQDNFVASGYINVAEPKALWRIFGEMRQTL
jgi:hypothetical protein